MPTLKVLLNHLKPKPKPSNAERAAFLDHKHTGGNPKFINGEPNPNYRPRRKDDPEQGR